MDANVPLIVPEVNGDTLDPKATVIANPNCVAAILTMALGPLTQLAPLKRVVVSTYHNSDGHLVFVLQRDTTLLLCQFQATQDNNCAQLDAE